MTLFGPHPHDLGRHFCSTGPGNWRGGARSSRLFSIRIRVGRQPAPDARRGMFTPTTPPSGPRRARHSRRGVFAIHGCRMAPRATGTAACTAVPLSVPEAGGFMRRQRMSNSSRISDERLLLALSMLRDGMSSYKVSDAIGWARGAMLRDVSAVIWADIDHSGEDRGAVLSGYPWARGRS